MYVCRCFFVGWIREYKEYWYEEESESEKVVQDALDKLMVGRTAFVIAHRLSTIKNADQILVLNDGVIAERGTHDELMAKGGLYYDLYTMSAKVTEAEDSVEDKKKEG